MKTTDMEQHRPEKSKIYEYLMEAIGKMLGKKVQTSTDYHKLCMDIKFRTGQTIGDTTLKRIFGYVNDSVEPRQHTLDILAQYIGYADWDSFCHAITEGSPHESGMVLSRSLLTSSLIKGSVIRLTWQPERVCICQYRGQNMFVVLRSENTRLTQGTTFQCSLIIAGEPLTLDHVCLEGSLDPCVYQVGSVNGVQFDVMTSE